MKYFVVDAFAEKVFEGNPAGVCVMDSWLDDALMEKIAMENNLSETAYAVKEGDGYRLRWFTPGGEISLCGHATLATAFVLDHFYTPIADPLVFYTLGGTLFVSKQENLYELDFPAYDLKKVPITQEIEAALGIKPTAAYLGRDLLCILETEQHVINATPDFLKLKSLPDGLGLHITAKGTAFDCVSRSFFPKINVSEDPVCGSGHCHIIPYWMNKTGKQKIVARQSSKRGGTLLCRMKKNRVFMAGQAALYLEGEIHIL